MATFRKILSTYLLVWLTLLCVVAFYWNRFGFSVDPFRLPPVDCHWFKVSMAEIYISVTMLMIGSLLPIDEIKMVLKRWHKILGGTCIQYISMPALAFLAACLFGLHDATFYGLMLVGCVPGAMASNMLTLMSRGNVSYSVGLTTSATLLSPIVVPLTLWMAIGQHVHFDVLEMSRTLLITVVLPVGIGFTLAQKCQLWNRFAHAMGEIVANVVIIWIIASVVAGNRERIAQFPVHLVPPMLLVNFGGYACGFLGGKLLRLDNRMTRALILEIGMQNAGLGVMLAQKYFPDKPEVALCCAMYTFGCMFTGILVAQGLRFLSRNEVDPEEQEEQGVKAEEAGA